MSDYRWLRAKPSGYVHAFAVGNILNAAVCGTWVKYITDDYPPYATRCGRCVARTAEGSTGSAAGDAA